ncbi:MAG: PRC-barrel domain-containing protein [Bdellovibrionales bacterium]|nr:PRC-barrel domain-containing protein [Bdellovibrionales bacterium]
MLRSLKDLIGYKVVTANGPIGKCKDILFKDRDWNVQYIDIETGNWLPGRRVLLSPNCIGIPHWSSHLIPTILSPQQIEDSPKLEENAPVSRQWENHYFSYYGWSHYAIGGQDWGYSTFPQSFIKPNNRYKKPTINYDGSLRSLNEVLGYSLTSTTGSFGSISDLYIELSSWHIKYLYCDTIKWLPSKKVLLSTSWINSVSWAGKSVNVNLRQGEITSLPHYNGDISLSSAHEELVDRSQPKTPPAHEAAG